MSQARRLITLGYAPLNDCAPLVAALELGLFAEAGLDVRLRRVLSWATARDLLTIGALDGAQMLAPVVLASQANAPASQLVTPLVLSLGGNCIVASNALFDEMRKLDPLSGLDPMITAKTLAAVAHARQRNGQPLLRFGVVFRQSSHFYDVRRLIIAGGGDPARDISVAVVPPQETERFLEQGLLDGFCAGEPWGSLAYSRGYGSIIATSNDLWPNRIEKVLAFTKTFVDADAGLTKVIVQAVMHAAKWLDGQDARAAMAGILVDAGYLQLPVDVVAAGLCGRLTRFKDASPQNDNDHMVFSRYAAGFPWRSQGDWFAGQLQETGFLQAGDTQALVDDAFRVELYRDAALGLGEPYPTIDRKPEGLEATQWLLQEATIPIIMGRNARFERPIA